MAVHPRLLETINALALLGLAGVLAAAYAFQLAFGELPCPLCMLQRVAFAAVAFGFLLNLRYGSRAAHHGIIILAALYGMAVSGRQTLLHIVPGTGAYGEAILGLHFYTWAFVLFAVTVLASAGLLLMQPAEDHRPVAIGRFARLAAGCAIAVTLANAVTSFVQCGPIECADNPVSYWLLDLVRR